ncbi:branched chain amino acid aminotransferase [Tenuifilaceae bacterium CYCD]|nr:branched chain amino acid aminotransferase [Tenuifilaceae bacterium CYCD]
MTNSMNTNVQYFIKNGDLVPINLFCNDLIEGHKIIYEVIRVIESTPIFLTDHINRLAQSIKLASLPPSNYDLIRTSIKQLLQKNPISQQNIKVVVCYKSEKDTPIFTAYFIPSKYPNQSEKINGIEVRTIRATRVNPEVKAENKSLRACADEVIANTGCYEVLMINDSCNITEGSRSNVFFVKNGKLITAPSSVVLGGITRIKILEICSRQGIEVIPECISISQISGIDGGFISGTSPGVLTISRIDNIKLNVNIDLIKQINAEYETLITNEIQSWKSNQ